MSELRNCPGCGYPRYQHGQGSHLASGEVTCMTPGPGETIMRFWKGNKLAAEFSWPTGAVCYAFMRQYGPESDTAMYWPVERQLRNFLTGPAGFNSTWDDEATFTELLEEVRSAIYAQDGISDHAP